MIDPEQLRDAIWRSSWSRLLAPLRLVAERRGESVYVVGGFVRDLLIGREPADLDLVVEGDGVGFGVDLSEHLGAPLRRSDRFLTAEIVLEGAGRLDVSTARRESYGAPGALPEVEPASLAEDLERRDFTVNTFALGLAGEVPDEPLAHPLAAADLDRRLVRVLHGRSFVDDPTRLLRAVDLELRIDGRMEPDTEGLVRDAVAAEALETVSGQRLWAVIEASLVQPAPIRPLLERWQELGLFAVLFPGFAPLAERLELVDDCLALADRLSAAECPDGAASHRHALTVLLPLAWGAPESRVRAWIQRYAPPRRTSRTLSGADARLSAVLAALSGGEPRRSTDHAVLAALSLAELALVGALSGPGEAERVVAEVSTSRRTRLGISARDLVARGTRPGPAIGRALERTLGARLDGLVERDGELDYALRELDAPE